MPSFRWLDHCRVHIEDHPRHPMPVSLWEQIYGHRSAREAENEKDPTLRIREALVGGLHWRIVFKVLNDGSILPISGHQIEKQSKRINAKRRRRQP